MTKKSNTLPIGYHLHRYRIESVLGAGGFGITYKAVHEALRSRAAIKEYFPVEWSYRDRDEINVLANTQGALLTSEAGEEACYAWGLERFLYEARVLAQVSHPGVVRVRDFFEANGTAYIVMDYEDGEPLSHVLQREKTLSEQYIRQVLGHVLPALETVHALGYLHRDLKPANIYRCADGRTILIDFGAARQALSQRSKNITSVFTVGYSPIEQYLVDSKSYGPWTDIYALGAVLYQGVTGRMPVEAPARVLDDPLKPAVEAAEGRYSPELLRLIDRAMAIRPEKRFQSIAEVRAALEASPPSAPAVPWAGDDGDTIIFSPPPDGSPGGGKPSGESEQAQPKRRLDWRWGAALLAVVVAAVVAWIVIAPPWESSKPPPANPQAGQGYTEPSTGMKFIWVPSGCFSMGSPETDRERYANEIPHQVCPSGFWMGKYEVTNVQYQRFNGHHDSGNDESYSLNGPDQPVARVSWQEAVAYADWLSGKTGLGFRLPTEAEWEYAARGGKTDSRDWGNDPKQACRYANIYDDTARKAKPRNWAHYPCEDGQIAAAPVGKYEANAFGLHDMLGNVAEWTCSEYDSAYKGDEKQCADRNAATGRRVLRGGSWSEYPGLVRFAYRFPSGPEFRKFDVGFRLVLQP